MQEKKKSDSIQRRLHALAHGALLGMSSDWRGDLSRLLRSGAPIDQSLRDELADIIDGQSQITISMKNHGQISKRFEGLKARRNWFLHGEIVSQFVKNSERVDDAFWEASSQILRDETYCRKKYYYFKHCSDWVSEVRSKGVFFSMMSDQALRDVWHYSAIDQETDYPNPPTPNEFDERRRTQIECLLQLMGGRDDSNAIGILVALWDHLPPETA